MKDLLKVRQRTTMDDVNSQLGTYGKSIFIRPTGFGKTWLLVEELAKKYIQKYPNKKVLYIYPLDIIVTEIIGTKERTVYETSKENPSETIEKTIKIPPKYLEDGIIQLNKNFEFISYQKLSLEYNKDNSYWYNELSNNDVSLIILDEVHRAGSETFYKIWDSIKCLVGPNKLHVVGATATPNRMDDSNEKEPVIDYIFDDKQAYEYTLGDAFNDGLIPKMIIETNKFAVEVLIKKLRAKVKNSKSKVAQQNFNTEVAKLRKSVGDEHFIISKAIEKAGYDPLTEKYYKFILFYPNKADLAAEAEEAEGWFRDAFNIIKKQYGLKKGFKIRTTYLTSQDEDGSLKELASKYPNRQYCDKTRQIEELTEENNTVDLIFTIDMVNMGYHVPNITGIVMRRGTKSEITYYQQLGRAISVTAEHNPIIFDFVGNVYEKFWFKNESMPRNSDNPLNQAIVASTGEKDDTGLMGISMKYVETVDEFDTFIARFNGGEDSFIKQEIELLYIEMEMPLYMLASLKNWTIKETISKLKKYKINIRTEENQYMLIMGKVKYYIEQSKNEDNKAKKAELQKIAKNYINTLHYINCKDAVYGKCKYITNKNATTLYNILNR